jgi:hypothetical protein
MQELRTYPTTTAALLELAGWLRHRGVTLVVMESTSSYWKGASYLLEADGFECSLVNAPSPSSRREAIRGGSCPSDSGPPRRAVRVKPVDRRAGVLRII